MPSFWIRSANSPNAHLRMDASKVTAFNGAGSGTVNCQFYANGSEPQATAGNDEVFQLVPIPGSTAFAIQSVANPMRIYASTAPKLPRSTELEAVRSTVSFILQDLSRRWWPVTMRFLKSFL
jgi:hypothetical protein